MGKLLDRLNQLSDSGGQSLGFTADKDDNQAHMGIVAVIRSSDKELVATALDMGADALVLGGKSPKKLGGDIPVGTMACTGGDFVVLSLGDDFGDTLVDGNMDVVLTLEAGTSDEVMRSIEALPVDAVSMEVPSSPSSLEDLLPLYRAARATRKPLLAQVPVGLEQPELAAIRDAGVDALVVEVAKDNVDALSALRDQIAGLPPKRHRPDRGKSAPVLGLPPGAGGQR